MNVANGTVILSLCYSATYLPAPVLSAFQYGYFALLIGLGSFISGSTMSLVSPVITIISLILGSILGVILWFIMRVAQWARPDLTANGLCVQALAYFDALNKYGAPDCLFIPVFVMGIFMMYMNYRNYRRSFNWILGPVVVGGFVFYTIVEFTLGRIFWYQYLVNIGIIGLISFIVCYSIHSFYESDMREHFDILVSIFWDLMTTHQKHRFHLNTSSYHSDAKNRADKHRHLHSEIAARKLRHWHHRYLVEALRAIVEKLEHNDDY